MTIQSTITVRMKDQYGKPVFYPACAASHIFASIAGTNTLTQPTLQPGCVIRRENWSVLQKQGAVTAEQMRECKQRMNTFAYIGSIRDKPIVRCVYQADISGNKFQMPGSAGAADDAAGVTPEGDQF